MCSIAMGLQIILTNQLSYHLGKQDYNQLLIIMDSTILCFPILILFIFLVLNCLSDYWIRLYTSDGPTIQEILNTIPYTNLLLITDQSALMFIGILKGIRIENVGIVCYTVGYYVYAMPAILLYFMPAPLRFTTGKNERRELRRTQRLHRLQQSRL